MALFQEKTYHHRSVRLNYAEGPNSGPPLVVLHGGTVEWRFMMPVLPLMARRWHVFACDLRGHGLSSHSPNQYHLANFASDLVSFTQNVAQSPAVLLGFSWGGLVALHAASQASFRAFVLESPPLDLHRRTMLESPVGDYFKWVRQAVRSGMDLDTLTEMVHQKGLAKTQEASREWARAFSRLDPTYIDMLLDGSALSGMDFKQILQSVSAPTLLLLAGLHKRTLSEEDIRFANENIHQLNVVEVDGAENAIHHSHPVQMVDHIERFIDSQAG